MTVGDHVRERLAWLAPWYRRAPRADQAVVDRVLSPSSATCPCPDVDTVVWHLDEVDALLLRIALATAQRPRLLVVDDVDQVHDRARRRIVWDRLAALAAHGRHGRRVVRRPRRGRRHPLDRPARLRPHPLKVRHALAHLRHRAAPVRPWTPPRLAVAAMLLVPLLYGALYLWAFWDPTGHLDAMPVALVNADAGRRPRRHRGSPRARTSPTS